MDCFSHLVSQAGEARQKRKNFHAADVRVALDRPVHDDESTPIRRVDARGRLERVERGQHEKHISDTDDLFVRDHVARNGQRNDPADEVAV